MAAEKRLSDIEPGTDGPHCLFHALDLLGDVLLGVFLGQRAVPHGLFVGLQVVQLRSQALPFPFVALQDLAARFRSALVVSIRARVRIVCDLCVVVVHGCPLLDGVGCCRAEHVAEVRDARCIAPVGVEPSRAGHLPVLLCLAHVCQMSRAVPRTEPRTLRATPRSTNRATKDVHGLLLPLILQIGPNLQICSDPFLSLAYQGVFLYLLLAILLFWPVGAMCINSTRA